MENRERKEKFPFFKNNENYIYLDSGATSIKPKVMVDSIVEYYYNFGNSYDKGIGKLSLGVIKKYRKAIKNISNFINAEKDEIIITSGTTDGLNKIANSIIKNLNPGDEIILGKFEHTSNYLIWNELAKKNGIKVKFYELDLENFVIDLEHLKTLVNNKTKLISLTHKYNIFGTTNDVSAVKKIVGKDVFLVVDGAQAVGQIKIDVKEIDCDFYVFGAHKMFGPFGVGVLYAKKEILENLDPFQLGGGMDEGYDLEKYESKTSPEKFYAGTRNITGVIGLSSAINFINEIGIEKIKKHNEKLKKYLEEEINKIPGIKIINKNVPGTILYFSYKDINANYLGKELSKKNIFIRPNASCVKLRNKLYSQEKVIRVSLHIYNNKKDIDEFINNLKEI